MASSSFTRCPSDRDAKVLQVLCRQARKDRLVYLILAERRLILSEAKAPQPDHDVHDGAPQSGVADIITVKVVGARVRAPPLFRGLVVSSPCVVRQERFVLQRQLAQNG